MKIKVKKRPGKPPVRFSVLFFRNIPSDVATMFKAKCAENGETMLKAITRLMTSYIKDEE